MDKDAALTLALEFIERVNKDGWILADFEPQMYEAITAIKEALAQPEQEPSITKEARGTLILHSGWDDLPDGTKFYTTPPKRRDEP